MNRKFGLSRSGLAVRVSLFTLCFILFGVASAGAVVDNKSNTPQLGKNGAEAVATLGKRLPVVADAYGLNTVELTNLFLEDLTLFVDGNGELYYADLPFPEDSASSEEGIVGTDVAPFDPSQTFLLHSLPGATHVIYLDFDGHTTVAGTSWNSGYSFYSPAYDIDGDPDTFSATEIERIQIIWQIVAEDYSPFDVDVTTEDPGSVALSDQGSGDIYYGSRVVFTDDTWANCGCGGHAYIGSFDDRYDEPVFVYNKSLVGASEAGSHEVGHAVNLSHDGTSTAAYYYGHGSGATGWAPIMGAAYYEPVAQWSMGEYYDANNGGPAANYGYGPDDLAVMASMTNGNGFGYRLDDHGATRQTASSLTTVGNSVSGAGIIELTTDVDVFSFETGAGQVDLSIIGAPPSSNLDVYAELYDASDSLIAVNNPVDQLPASFSIVLDAGTYYLHIDGTGMGSPMDPTPTGYTQYASQGQYTISGTTVDPEPLAKYVILLIGDGMGFEQVKAANYFNDGNLSFENLPYATSMRTYSADNSVTDSAAAATAMATGQKVNNGVISMAYPGDGSELETLLEIFKAQGKEVGLVSTAYLSHATPAAFGAHDPSRNNTSAIANDYLTQTQPHVLLGGGANGMSSSAAASAGYTVVTDRVGMQSLDTETETFVSGQFGISHLPYEYDGDYSSLPHLNQMAETAIAILDNNTVEGFFLMIEGGRIDHAGHDNNLERNVQESIEFGNTVQKVLDWVNDTGNDSSWTNTLVLVTADHETGGLTVTQDNGPGNYPTVTWTSGDHSGVNVPLYADGEGADQITTSPVDNTDVYSILLQQYVPAPNNPPVADDQGVTTDEDTAVGVTLTGSDPDSDPLTFSVTSGPSDGTLSGNAPDLTYTPDGNYNGADSFSFTVNDGFDDSLEATVSITVNSVNDLPSADDQTVVTDEDTGLGITLTGSDVDTNDTLSFAVADGPSNGALSGTPPSLTYTPSEDFNGSDSFTFTANDGTVDSDVATVSITVDPVNDSPTADDRAVSTSEDTSLAITLSGSDVDAGDTLSFAVAGGPSSGALSGTPPSLTYTPDENFNGSDSFTFTANDGTVDSDVATVSITVDPINDSPTADDQTASTSEDTALGITLSGSDVDTGDTLSFAVAGGPSSGALSGTPPSLTYTPNENFNGSDSFTFTASDGLVDSGVATIDVTVSPINDAPEADDQTVATDEDTPVGITLTGSDVDGDSITFAIASSPSHGSLSGSGASVTYSPDENFNGADSFTFRVNDGFVDSTFATVDITINAINDTPQAYDQTVSTQEDTSLGITLTGSDVDADLLTFNVVSNPPNGILSGTAPDLSYTASPGYSGPDSFTFTVNDGTENSPLATVNITVTPVNDPPTADDQGVSTEEDTPLPITLTGSDPESDPLTFSVENDPAHGSLSGTLPNLTYTPAGDYNGPDSFTFTVNDGLVDSVSATVDITVNPVNDAPEADDQSVATDEDAATGITLTGSDADGDDLIFAVAASPSHGSLSGSPPNLTYTPEADYIGSDSFTFIANDGAVDSDIASVDITVNSVNDAPSANAQSVATDEDTPVAITLTGSDVDGDPLSFTVAAGPSNGTLSGSAPNLTYSPDGDYFGPDSFTFRVNDGLVDSLLAAIDITVSPVNDAPEADNRALSTQENTSLDIMLSGSDVDGDSLTFIIVSSPINGSLSGTAPDISYAPNAGYNGPDSITFIVNDGTENSPQAAVDITVTPVNDPPAAHDQDAGTEEDTPVAITLTGSDPDRDSLTYSIVSGPSNGSLSGTLPNLTYTPTGDYNGPDSFTFTVNDGLVDSGSATVSITVNPVNDVPEADDQTLATGEDVSVDITLTGSDIDGDPLTFSVDSGPSHGSLSGVLPNLTYTPNSDYYGPDSFAFTTNDSHSASAGATIGITVNPVNDAPEADHQSVVATEDLPADVTLTGSDIDGDSLTFSVVSGPDHGSLSGIAPDFTYTPDGDYFGPDSFIFRANDGFVDSPLATINFTVNSVNDAPEADDQATLTQESTSLDITLTGSDVDGDALTFNVVNNPTYGALSGTAPDLSYTPNAGYNGPDSFTFTVNDGIEDSPLAAVNITVTPVNDPPTADDQETSTGEDTAVAITLTGSDPDGDSLTYSVVAGPSNGSLTGSAPYLTYTPGGNYNGSDSFTFKVNDGFVDSAAGTINIIVNPVNDAPAANSQSTATEEDVATSITLTGSDVDGDGLLFNVVSNPSHGTLSGSAPDLTYAPDADYNGSDSFTFTTNDGAVDSAIATVDITINPVNDAPSADDQSVETDEDTPANITLTGSDVDSDPLSYSVAVGPSNGTLSGIPPNLSYTPFGNFSGSDSFSFVANDGTVDSPSAIVGITVNAVNDSPTVEAGIDLEVVLPSSASLDGTVSDDGLPQPPSVVTAWSKISGPGSVSFGDAGAVDTNASFTEAGVYVLRLTADDGELTASDDVTVTANTPPSDSPYLEFGQVSDVGENWVPVSVSRSYNSMVIVATANVNSGDPAAVVRIQNAFGNSFEVRVDGVGGGSPSNVTVHYFAIEEGVYNAADHGVTMEAVKYISTVTDDDDSWVGESRTLANSYTGPVVIGQVMSYADANFSVFWSRGASAVDPATDTDFWVGKHVGEDPVTSRADEIVGYVVIEAGGGSIEGINYVAGLGADTVQGMGNHPPYSYGLSGLASATTAVVSQAAMDGSDGGWAHLFGANPVSSANLDLVIDEDQLGGSERSHPKEQVAYLVFEDPNQAPSADFTSDATDLTADFTDTSSDGDGTVVGWSWDFGDGNTSTEQNPSHTYTSASTYDVGLTVTDDDGATDSTSYSVTVTAPNVPPTADFTYITTFLSADFTDVSTDGDGTVTGWSWDFGDGNTSTAQSPSHTYTSAGTYDVGLTATDDDGATDTTSQSVTVTAPNTSPTAAFTYNSIDLTADFTDISTDGDGTVASWSWNFGDGNTSTEQNPSHTYAAAGTYNVTLTASDDDGATDTASHSVTVTKTPIGEIVYVSSSSGGKIGAVTFADEDIIAYDPGTDLWSMHFDGSDVGMSGSGSLDVDAFHLLDDGSILLSIAGSSSLPDVGSVDDSDIVRFVPTSLGSATAGTFEWYFDGSDVGLEANGEDVDAIYFMGADLILSTSGGFSVAGASGNDEDLIRFSPNSLGASTNGTWSLYFDGSDVGLNTSSDEDSWGVWIDDDNGDIYITSRGSFSAGGISGDCDDIYVCSPLSLGDNTTCTFRLHFDAGSVGYDNERIDGIMITRYPAGIVRKHIVTEDTGPITDRR